MHIPSKAYFRKGNNRFRRIRHNHNKRVSRRDHNKTIPYSVHKPLLHILNTDLHIDNLCKMIYRILHIHKYHYKSDKNIVFKEKVRNIQCLSLHRIQTHIHPRSLVCLYTTYPLLPVHSKQDVNKHS